jgi:Spy/CpxP family protein refolding chaperone
VTIVDTTLAGKVVRQQILWVAVSLSLALNVFFVAGALWTRFHAPPPLTRAMRFDEMATALGLDQKQRQAFAGYSQIMQAQLEKTRDSAQPLVRAAWAEVSRPHADEAKVMQLLDQAALVRRAHLKQITTATIAFLQNLSPEQRAKFVTVAHRGPPPWALQFASRRN